MKDRGAAAAAAFITVVIHKALSEKLSKHNGWRGVTVAVPSSSRNSAGLSIFLLQTFSYRMDLLTDARREARLKKDIL